MTDQLTIPDIADLLREEIRGGTCSSVEELEERLCDTTRKRSRMPSTASPATTDLICTEQGGWASSVRLEI